MKHEDNCHVFKANLNYKRIIHSDDLDEDLYVKGYLGVMRSENGGLTKVWFSNCPFCGEKL